MIPTSILKPRSKLKSVKKGKIVIGSRGTSSSSYNTVDNGNYSSPDNGRRIGKALGYDYNSKKNEVGSKKVDGGLI